MTQEMAPTGTNYDAPPRGGNGLAIAGFVCSLVGAVFFWIVLAPLGIIFGGIGLARANRGAAHRGLAIAAIVIGVIDIVAYIIVAIALAKNGGSFHYHIG